MYTRSKFLQYKVLDSWSWSYKWLSYLIRELRTEFGSPARVVHILIQWAISSPNTPPLHSIFFFFFDHCSISKCHILQEWTWASLPSPKSQGYHPCFHVSVACLGLATWHVTFFSLPVCWGIGSNHVLACQLGPGWEVALCPHTRPCWLLASNLAFCASQVLVLGHIDLIK